MTKRKRYLVTGGGGFVGKALCRRLKARGDRVISISRGDYPELREFGVETVRADLASSLSDLAPHFKGVDGVFHVASKVDMWGEYNDFHRANVIGTRHVIEACRVSGVKYLVYTSSPSVIADHTDLKGVDESYPYPDHHLAYYPETKARAERDILSASDQQLYTIALRPHLIWGPGDTNLIPTLVGKAQAGRLVQVGDGTNMTDITYIDDCVEAHLCAMDALQNNPHCRGKAYFISQGQPVNVWDWINQVLEANALPRIKKKISAKLAYALAAICEGWCRVTRSKKEPLLTRFLVSEMATSHYFDISAAEKDLGFIPGHSVEQAMEVTFGPGTQSQKAA